MNTRFTLIATTSVLIASSTIMLTPAYVATPETPAEMQATHIQSLITAEHNTPEGAIQPVSAVETKSSKPTPPKEVQKPSSTTEQLHTLEEFTAAGVINWGGYKFTYYSEKVLPGTGLEIPGRHINENGYVADADGYIVLASDAPKGTVYDTPFGNKGKVYDRGVSGNHLDVYVK